VLAKSECRPQRPSLASSFTKPTIVAIAERVDVTATASFEVAASRLPAAQGSAAAVSATQYLKR
jgi:hypothetical protein